MHGRGPGGVDAGGSRLSWKTEMAKAKPFDAAEYLDSPDMIAAYLNEAFESEDALPSRLPSARVLAPAA